MPKLILQFEGVALKEYVVGANVTIGRLPDNTVTIDNPAVSGHHARIFRNGDDFILEDLESTNGTYVNEKHVYGHTLRHGDVVLIGKHRLVFEHTASAQTAAPEPVIPDFGNTVYLDTRRHRELLAKVRDTRPAPGIRPAAAPPRAPGVLRVLTGRADRTEYNLDARTSLVGASADAAIKLHGWFKPKVAVTVTRDGDTYSVTPVGGQVYVNGERLRERRDINDGDVLQVPGLTLQFHAPAAAPAASTRRIS